MSRKRTVTPDPRAAHPTFSLLRVFQRLTYASLATSTAIFILSMLNLGEASLWDNPVTSTLTIVYHVVILILHKRDHHTRHRAQDGSPSYHRLYPTSKVASLVFAYILACSWVIPIPFISIMGGLSGNEFFNETSPRFAGNTHTVRAELAFNIIELGIMWAIAAISTRMRVVPERRTHGHKQM
jgi:hypothetical protein